MRGLHATQPACDRAKHAIPHRLGCQFDGYDLRKRWEEDALAADEVRAAAWAEVRQPLELQLAPLGRPALDALAARPGERILDIGCGGGDTVLDLARISRILRFS